MRKKRRCRHVLKFVFGLLGMLGSAAWSALKIKGIVEGDGTAEEKAVAVEARLETFRKKCSEFAASTEPTWDDAIFAGLADWLDEAAEFIVAKWG